MTDRDPDIIEVDDYRVVGEEVTPIVDEDEEPPPPYHSEVWRREVRTTGPGCCFGLSITIFLLTVIFLLGTCVACWLILQTLGLF